MALTKEQFFSEHEKTRPDVHEVDLPGGKKVWVRSISAREKTLYEQACNDKKKGGMASMRERLVILCACDENGNPLFQQADMARVGNLPVTTLEPIFDKAYEINGFKSKLIEEIRKNSESAPTDD